MGGPRVTGSYRGNAEDPASRGYGAVRTPDDGHSLSFPDTSQGTDSPLGFAGHLVTRGIEESIPGPFKAATRAAWGLASRLAGLADGGVVCEPCTARVANSGGHLHLGGSCFGCAECMGPPSWAVPR